MLKKYILISLCLFVLAGCQSPPFLYRPTIQQGNVITPDMIEKLKPGMSADHVRYLLGEPILVPTFNPHRWEYIYTHQVNRAKMERRLVTVYFQNGFLEKVTSEPAASPAK
ncbi:MAG: outer membrane protein assembly factor BamE [Gammaproteobacteria bacterium]